MIGPLTDVESGAQAGRDSLPMREAAPGTRRLKARDVVTSWPVARILGARDIKVKYKQSALGPLWLFLQPMGMLLAITIAFSGVTDVGTRGVPYVLFGLVGITVWNFISMTLAVAPTAFASNSTLLKRTTAPRPAFVTATVLSNVPLLGILISVTLIASLLGHGFDLQMLVLPVLVAWLLVFAWGAVLVVAPIAARFRDAIALVPLIVQAGIFVSPVGYDISTAPSNIKLLVSLNPITGIIEAWRWALLGLQPQWGVVALAVALTVVLVVVGWAIFRRMEVRLADFV